MSLVVMTQYTLNALKGWPNPAALDFTAEFDPSLADTLVLPGSVLMLSETGTYLLGVGDLQVMPLFAFNGSQDPDVSNPNGGNPATDKGAWVPINPTGQALAFPAVAPFELVSTAFVTDADYPPNTPLTSATSGDTAGLLAPGVIGTNMVVGLVSRGVVDNGYGYDAVAFWPFPIFPV